MDRQKQNIFHGDKTLAQLAARRRLKETPALNPGILIWFSLHLHLQNKCWQAFFFPFLFILLMEKIDLICPQSESGNVAESLYLWWQKEKQSHRRHKPVWASLSSICSHVHAFPFYFLLSAAGHTQRLGHFLCDWVMNDNSLIIWQNWSL